MERIRLVGNIVAIVFDDTVLHKAEKLRGKKMHSGEKMLRTK